MIEKNKKFDEVDYIPIQNSITDTDLHKEKDVGDTPPDNTPFNEGIKKALKKRSVSSSAPKFFSDNDYTIQNQFFPEKEKIFSADFDTFLRLVEPAKLSVCMTKDIFELCAIHGIFFDEAGVILLRKFFKKVLSMWQNRKKITVEKLVDIFFDIYHKNKRFTQTKENLLLVGEFAVYLCASIMFIDTDTNEVIK